MVPCHNPPYCRPLFAARCQAHRRGNMHRWSSGLWQQPSRSYSAGSAPNVRIVNWMVFTF